MSAAEDQDEECVAESLETIPESPQKIRIDKLVQHYKELDVPKTVRESAATLLTNLASHEDLKGDEKTLCTCLIYVYLLDYRDSHPTPDDRPLTPPVSVSDLLSHSDVTVPEFLTKMRQLRGYHGFSRTVSQRLTSLERNFLVVSPLYIKFEKIFEEMFIKDDDSADTSSAEFSETEGFHFKKKLTWTLFIYAKAVLLKGNPELVSAFHLLLACLDYVTNVTPSFQLKPPFDMLRQSGADTLPQLCIQYKLETPVVTTQETALLRILQDLPGDGHTLDLWRMQDAYTALYRRQGDLDERLFLSHHRHLVDSRDNTQTSPPSDLIEPPQTPVSAALNTVHQLHALLAGAADKPSRNLIPFFKACPEDPQPAIEARLAQLKEQFVNGFVGAGGSSDIGSSRFILTTRLYYRVMESILKLEETRLGRSDFPHLCNSSVFHTSLAACAATVVMASYATQARKNLPLRPPLAFQDNSDMQFPWILDIFELKAYDFYKMIESFIKAEPKLTKDIIKHLQEIENKVLESIAWESGSPLHEALATSPPPTSPPLQTNHPPPQISLSPFRSTYGGSCDIPEAPKSPTPRRSRQLNNFFNKVCRLGYQRLQHLCTQLDIPTDVQQKIWTCLEHCLSHYWTLMRDRHLDQILMCCVYAICRVVDSEIKFKRIVTVYSTLPHAVPEVYKRVLVRGTEYSSIINFYNSVFVDSLKDYVVQFADGRHIPSMSPVPKNVASPLTASPVYNVPGKKNFFVSPMKDSPFKPPLTPGRMTPRTRQIYCFGQGLGSSEKLKAINECLRASSRHNSPTVFRSQKRLTFDQPSEPSANAEPESIIVVKRARLALNFDNPPAEVAPPATASPARTTGQPQSG